MQEQVAVVGHQAVVVQPPAAALAVVGAEAVEVAVVVVIDDDGRAVVSPIDDVVAGGFGRLPAAGQARPVRCSSGITRKVKTEALARLEAARLINVDRANGRNPVVTVLAVPARPPRQPT